MSLIYAASPSASDIQTAINAASANDTVIVPAGSAVWNSEGITCTKGITLDFTNVHITRGTGTTTLITIGNHPTDRFRLTGGKFYQSTTSRQLVISGGFSNAKFRVDNCLFQTTASNSYLIIIYTAWGLFDNCVFIGESASEIVHNEAWGAGNSGGWSEDVVQGSDNAVYFEDCVFSKYNLEDYYFWGTSGIQNYYGSRTVVRHCTFNYTQFDNHGTQGSVGGRWYEVYNNRFVVPPGGNQSHFMHLRAGSGVIYNNTIVWTAPSPKPSLMVTEEDVPLLSAGRVDGVVNVRTNTTHYLSSGSYVKVLGIEYTGDDPNGYFIINVTGTNTFTYSNTGSNETFTVPPWAEFKSFVQYYPSLYQIGRGKDQVLDPLYFWNNTVEPVVTGYAVYLVQEGRDYYNNTIKPGYSPLVYPHPLRFAPKISGRNVNRNVTTMFI